MTTVGLRTYRIDATEFPLEVEITAAKLPANRSIVGNLRVSKDGRLQARIAPDVVEDQPARKVRYGIPRPKNPPAAYDITNTVECWFTDKAPDDAKYQIVITSGNGDQATTTVRLPTINPGVANLAFQVREGRPV